MKKAVIVSAVRTPLGILNGDLSGLKEQDLAALVYQEAVNRAGIDPAELDEAILGVAKQTSLPSNCARYAVLKAGLPLELSAYTVHRQSASGLQAVANGYWQIINGDGAVILAGGAESMSQIPLEVRGARYAFNQQTEILYHPIEAQAVSTQPKETYGTLTAEALAGKLAKAWDISEAAQSAYAQRSLGLAQSAEAGCSLLPVTVKTGKTLTEVGRDGLYSQASPVARPGDGAAALVLIEAEKARALGAPVLAEVVDLCAAAGSPAGNGLTGLDAVRRLLSRTGTRAEQVSRWEVGELSAAQTLAFQRGLTSMGLTPGEAEARTNLQGGFLATGNPWGAGGAVLSVKLLDGLRGTGKLGVAVAPSEGGQSMAILLRVL